MKKGMYIPVGNSYYSGAGLMDIGVQMAGCKIQQSVDLDDAAVNHMKANPKYFGHSIVKADMSSKTVLDQPESDFYLFTFPCNKYSPVADIHGVRTGDEQFLHSLRHVALRQPDMYVVENVPGMRKFPVVMEALTKLPGYYVTVVCPVNASIWVPQRRERLIVFATRKPFSTSQPVCNRPVKLKDIIEPDAPVEMSACVVARIKGKYRDRPIVVDPSDPNAIAPTCVAHYAKDMGTRLVKDNRAKYGVRPFSIREYARLQGVPDDVRFPDNRIAYKLIGNGVEVHKARWIGQNIIKYFN